MMPEISLNILDIAQNSVSAGASLTTIAITANHASDTLSVVVSDNGCGMTPEQIVHVTDPFFTTRTTRKVGLGVPFFKMAAEQTGGSFNIESEVGVGTRTEAVFGLSHIDRMPIGDMASTMISLIGMNPDIDFVLEYRIDDNSFSADTREFRAVLGDDISLAELAIQDYLKGYIEEGINECGGDI